MPSLLLIGNEQDSHTDNSLRFRSAFTNADWSVKTVNHNDLVLDSGCLIFQRGTNEELSVDAFDLIWLLGFGPRATFLDRMQLLRHAEQTKFVNSIDAFMFYHSKAALAMTRLHEVSPPQVVSRNVKFLLERVYQGGDWVAKPTAGSFGRDVFALRACDPNLPQIIENLARQHYVLLQQRISTAREQRWFLAKGELIGAYQKIKTGLRGNIGAESTSSLCEPTEDETTLVRMIATELLDLGIHACAVDIAYPYLLDVNFVNPGWFETMEKLTGINLAEKLPPLFLDHTA